MRLLPVAGQAAMFPGDGARACPRVAVLSGEGHYLSLYARLFLQLICAGGGTIRAAVNWFPHEENVVSDPRRRSQGHPG